MNPAEGSSLKALVVENKAVGIPEEYLDALSSAAEEYEHVAGKRILIEIRTNQP
jgi:hypothetical protein